MSLSSLRPRRHSRLSSPSAATGPVSTATRPVRGRSTDTGRATRTAQPPCRGDAAFHSSAGRFMTAHSPFVRLGSTLLLESGSLRGKRVGILCNHASVDRGLAHIVDELSAADGVTLAAIFGPQHGFRSDVQDNMIETPHRDDPHRRVPIYSLYSETREPTAEMLRGLDVLVIDLQDIGARIYTYIYTMANCLRACGRHGVPVIVCDRPNPIGGVEVEGAALRAGFESFVGPVPIPERHGLYMG